MASAHALKSRTDARASERLPLDRAGVLRTAEQSIPIRIADLTREGCRIETEAEFAPGASVVVGIAGVGPTPGRMIWRGERGYGCAFDRSLPPGAVTAAFSPSNIAHFPGRPDMPEAPRATKLSGRARLGVLVGGIAASWGMVAVCAVCLLHL